MAEDDYTDDATPSQKALDSQLQQGNIVAAANYQGRIALAKTQVMEAVQEGGDAAAGRELLGRLDQMAEFPDSEDAPDVYKTFKAYIRGATGAAPPSGQAPAPSPTKKTIDRNKAMKDYADGKMTTSRAQELGIV